MYLLIRVLEEIMSCGIGLCPQEVTKVGFLSDVDMPGMRGPALGETLKEARPEMHVMLMSGQQDGNLLVLNYGWAFIRKPFVASRLVEMVTDVLHSPNRSQLGGEGFDTRKDTWSNREQETKRRKHQTDANAKAKNDNT